MAKPTSVPTESLVITEYPTSTWAKIRVLDPQDYAALQGSHVEVAFGTQVVAGFLWKAGLDHDGLWDLTLVIAGQLSAV